MNYISLVPHDVSNFILDFLPTQRDLKKVALIQDCKEGEGPTDTYIANLAKSRLTDYRFYELGHNSIMEMKNRVETLSESRSWRKPKSLYSINYEIKEIKKYIADLTDVMCDRSLITKFLFNLCGGETRYNLLPVLDATLGDLRDLDIHPERMTAPLMRGKLSDGSLFLAVRTKESDNDRITIDVIKHFSRTSQEVTDRLRSTKLIHKIDKMWSGLYVLPRGSVPLKSALLCCMEGFSTGHLMIVKNGAPDKLYDAYLTLIHEGRVEINPTKFIELA